MRPCKLELHKDPTITIQAPSYCVLFDVAKDILYLEMGDVSEYDFIINIYIFLKSLMGGVVNKIIIIVKEKFFLNPKM